MGAKLELGILGPVEVRLDDEPVGLGGPRQRAVLAVLAIRPNQVVSVDRLIDDIWEERPPDKAVHTVHVFVSRLRRALSAAGDRLITRPPGYVLELRVDELDADRFERIYKAGRAALNARRAEDAVALLTEALALWRGPPLADFTYEPFAQGAIARLDELRLGAREELIEAQLAAGRHEQVVSELEFLIREHPFRERPRGQLMLALYRCGRQAQALEAFQDARRTLIEELAVEPGDALRELEQAILRQDPALQLEAVGENAGSSSPVEVTEAEVQEPSAGDEESTAVVRKTATVLVTKLSAEGEADPEVALRSMETARFHVEEIVVRHGGAFVGGLGGELAWVFGVPLLREDDVVRTLRAADELRADLETLATTELPALTVRIGIATGEVIAESPTDVWGDPLSRAIGLAQAAVDGEILMGDTTRRLSFNATRVEPALDGTAWRLLGLAARRPIAVTTDGPMVGRDQELGRAHATFDRTRLGGEANLLTVLGEAGIGKSRLAQELGDRLAGEATVLTGRCLSYGEGVAFWPLREAVVQAAGEASRDGVRRLLDVADDANVVADILAAALGLAPAVSVSEQLPWAVRRLLESLAGERPVILVIDDVHWADAPLLDMIDYLVDWLRAPVVLLCLARPDLLETRPGWGGGHTRVNSIVLGPLDDAAALRLLDQRLGERQMSAGQRAQILVTAEGNPLFVEQLLQMSAEDPDWDRNPEIPGAIQTLLSARLDRLGPGERAFIERAAVIGREFWSTAVRELLPPEARSSADKHLRALVHRGLIHPDGNRSILAGEEQLRFHHILIRDVAYGSTPKSRRSELHERFADWLLARREHYDEFIGYHLEQAFRYQLELGTPAEAARTLAGRAGEHLAKAGRRALTRGDAHAGVRLLSSARDLLEAAGRREPEVLLALGAGLSDSGDLREAESVFTTALEQSKALGDDNLAARASIDLSLNHVLVDPSIPVAEMLRVADEAVQTFERAGDDGGIARAWHHVAWVRWTQSRAAEMEDVLDRALAHAERAGDWQMQSRILGFLARALMTGPQPVAEAVGRCVAILERAGDDVVLRAVTETMLGLLEAMRGNFDDARSFADSAKRRLDAVGLTVTVAVLQMYSGWIELMADTPERAIPGVRDAYDVLERVGEVSRRATTAAILGRLLFVHGDHDESARFLKISEEAASPDDAATQAVWRGTRARLLATAGDGKSATDMADSAVAIISKTDYVRLHGDALLDRALVLSALGKEDAAMRDLDEAARLYEQKGITSSLATVRRSYSALAALTE
ncbi:MAG TPA: BTAD domain-containing putative transcriptional regulator [Solirubrobacteraceae bacterium]|nr:BTAD domain-containing putative transcriptional regulator [Solirubrobacteraceae bacterium]